MSDGVPSTTNAKDSSRAPESQTREASAEFPAAVNAFNGREGVPVEDIGVLDQNVEEEEADLTLQGAGHGNPEGIVENADDATVDVKRAVRLMDKKEAEGAVSGRGQEIAGESDQFAVDSAGKSVKSEREANAMRGENAAPQHAAQVDNASTPSVSAAPQAADTLKGLANRENDSGTVARETVAALSSVPSKLTEQPEQVPAPSEHSVQMKSSLCTGAAEKTTLSKEIGDDVLVGVHSTTSGHSDLELPHAPNIAVGHVRETTVAELRRTELFPSKPKVGASLATDALSHPSSTLALPAEGGTDSEKERIAKGSEPKGPTPSIGEERAETMESSEKQDESAKCAGFHGAVAEAKPRNTAAQPMLSGVAVGASIPHHGIDFEDGNIRQSSMKDEKNMPGAHVKVDVKSPVHSVQMKSGEDFAPTNVERTEKTNTTASSPKAGHTDKDPTPVSVDHAVETSCTKAVAANATPMDGKSQEIDISSSDDQPVPNPARDSASISSAAVTGAQTSVKELSSAGSLDLEKQGSLFAGIPVGQFMTNADAGNLVTPSTAPEGPQVDANNCEKLNRMAKLDDSGAGRVDDSQIASGTKMEDMASVDEPSTGNEEGPNRDGKEPGTSEILPSTGRDSLTQNRKPRSVPSGSSATEVGEDEKDKSSIPVDLGPGSSASAVEGNAGNSIIAAPADRARNEETSTDIEKSDLAKAGKTPVSNRGTAFTCKLCNVQCGTLSQLAAHKQGKKHAKNLAKRNSSNTDEQHYPADVSKTVRGEATGTSISETITKGQTSNDGVENDVPSSGLSTVPVRGTLAAVVEHGAALSSGPVQKVPVAESHQSGQKSTPVLSSFRSGPKPVSFSTPQAFGKTRLNPAAAPFAPLAAFGLKISASIPANPGSSFTSKDEQAVERPGEEGVSKTCTDTVLPSRESTMHQAGQDRGALFGYVRPDGLTPAGSSGSPVLKSTKDACDTPTNEANLPTKPRKTADAPVEHRPEEISAVPAGQRHSATTQQMGVLENAGIPGNIEVLQDIRNVTVACVVHGAGERPKIRRKAGLFRVKVVYDASDGGGQSGVSILSEDSLTVPWQFLKGGASSLKCMRTKNKRTTLVFTRIGSEDIGTGSDSRPGKIIVELPTEDVCANVVAAVGEIDKRLAAPKTTGSLSTLPASEAAKAPTLTTRDEIEKKLKEKKLAVLKSLKKTKKAPSTIPAKAKTSTSALQSPGQAIPGPSSYPAQSIPHHGPSNVKGKLSATTLDGRAKKGLHGDSAPVSATGSDSGQFEGSDRSKSSVIAKMTDVGSVANSKGHESVVETALGAVAGDGIVSTSQLPATQNVSAGSGPVRNMVLSAVVGGSSKPEDGGSLGSMHADRLDPATKSSAIVSSPGGKKSILREKRAVGDSSEAPRQSVEKRVKFNVPDSVADVQRNQLGAIAGNPGIASATPPSKVSTQSGSASGDLAKRVKLNPIPGSLDGTPSDQRKQSAGRVVDVVAGVSQKPDERGTTKEAELIRVKAELSDKVEMVQKLLGQNAALSRNMEVLNAEKLERVAALNDAQAQVKAAKDCSAVSASRQRSALEASLREVRDMRQTFMKWRRQGAGCAVSGVRMECRPWSVEDYFERLRTFHPGTWSGFAELGTICPVTCARHGWFNSGYNRLTSTDGAHIVFRVSTMFGDDGRGRFGEEVRRVHQAIVATGHKMLSRWIGSSCPASFESVEVLSRTSEDLKGEAAKLRRFSISGLLDAGDGMLKVLPDEAAALAARLWCATQTTVGGQVVLCCSWCQAMHSVKDEADANGDAGLDMDVDVDMDINMDAARGLGVAAARRGETDTGGRRREKQLTHYPFCPLARDAPQSERTMVARWTSEPSAV